MRKSAKSGWWALWRLRCPGCREGSVFRGPITMNDDCPVCGLHFEREPGYFLGAMYFSYAMAIVLLGIFMLIGTLVWPQLDLGLVVLIAAAAYVPLVPLVFRYSRVAWIHFDRWFWPDAPGGESP